MTQPPFEGRLGPRGGPPSAGRREAAAPDAVGRGHAAVHVRPVGQRVPARARGGVPAGGPRARVERLPRRPPDGPVGPEHGDGPADAGHVPRPRTGDDPHGGRGERARRGRHRRRPAGDRLQGVRQRPRRVHRHRHRRRRRRAAAHRGRRQLAEQPRPAVHLRPSGQDFWTLVQAGYAPLGMVMGTCVYHIAHRGPLASLRTMGTNVEIEQYTEASTTRASWR